MEINGGNEAMKEMQEDATPLGWLGVWRMSQGSDVSAATLGYGTESRWDSRKGSCPKGVLE